MGGRESTHRCAFCLAAHTDVMKLIAGPDANICDVCVDAFYEKFFMSSEDATESDAQSTSPRQECSFCGKRRSEVKALAGNGQCAICDECISLCSEIVDEDAARNNRPRKNRREPSPEDIWANVEYVAENLVASEAVFYIYVRLAVASSMQEEFVKVWRRRLSAALAFDGAKAVSYLYGGESGTKARWAVMAHYVARRRELGEATKCVIEKMHESGILLRKATWYFMDGACHSVKHPEITVY